MDPPKTLINDYELRRLETILRNKQMLASLVTENLRFVSPQNVPKRPWNRQPPPSVLRRSLRRCGIPPPSPPPSFLRRSLRRRGIPPPSDPPPRPPRTRRQEAQTNQVLHSIRESSSDLLGAILTSSSDEVTLPGSKALELDPRSELVLRPENVNKFGNEAIFSMSFLPLRDRKVIVTGDGIGSLVFWDVDFSRSPSDDDDGEGIYLYRPHSKRVSGISVHPCSSRKIFTSSADGSIMLMDIEKETFDVLLSSEHWFYSICQCPQDNNSLFISEGAGLLKFWDEREGKASVFWKLHGDRINTIDINPENTNLMATSSTDELCCIWDLRNMKKESPKNMKSFSQHQGAVQSAYFSPSGKYLATISAVRGSVGIIGGANFDDLSMILQANWTYALSRAMWGWDDSYIFMGSKSKAINVISTTEKTITTLRSSYMTSVPYRFAVHDHPNMVGYLAGATSRGKPTFIVYQMYNTATEQEK